jgi:hypothetical protein
MSVQLPFTPPATAAPVGAIPPSHPNAGSAATLAVSLYHTRQPVTVPAAQPAGVSGPIQGIIQPNFLVPAQGAVLITAVLATPAVLAFTYDGGTAWATLQNGNAIPAQTVATVGTMVDVSDAANLAVAGTSAVQATYLDVTFLPGVQLPSIPGAQGSDTVTQGPPGTLPWLVASAGYGTVNLSTTSGTESQIVVPLTGGPGQLLIQNTSEAGSGWTILLTTQNSGVPLVSLPVPTATPLVLPYLAADAPPLYAVVGTPAGTGDWRVAWAWLR